MWTADDIETREVGVRMLVISRKVGESITIGSDVRVFVLKNNRGRIRLGIKAPGKPVVRDEIGEFKSNKIRRRFKQKQGKQDASEKE